MKGIVFTEFIDYVEHAFGLELTEQILSETPLASKGHYTSVGRYNHEELLALVDTIHQHTQTPHKTLVLHFAHHLFRRFSEMFPSMFTGVNSAFAFLESIETYIHVEVRKLYHDATLPTFSHEYPSSNSMVLNYTSERPLADLAEGLIEGCITYFGEPIQLTRTDFPGKDGFAAQFRLEKITA